MFAVGLPPREAVAAQDVVSLQEYKRATSRRFAQYDRVRCFIGGDVGWAAGNVQAINEPAPDGSGETLPYVVMLDAPLKRLISVPADANHCVRPELCFADGPAGGECAESVATTATRAQASAKLRFDVGARVACLTAGPAGTQWPRRWSAGTVKALWHQPMAAVAGGSAVPYSVALDAPPGTAEPVVLVQQDDHNYVRALELQPVGVCAAATALTRFTERRDAGQGWLEKADQQTLRVRRRAMNEYD